MKVKAIIHLAEEGGYWAEVPALPGCIKEGETIPSQDIVLANNNGVPPKAAKVCL